MANSMTGFASRAGGNASQKWMIELRSVNAKGLDIRLRLPEQMGSLDAPLRKMVQGHVARGSLSLSVRLEANEATAGFALDDVALGLAVASALRVEHEAQVQGLSMSTSTAASLLALPGVLKRVDGADIEVPLVEIRSDIEACLTEFQTARATEGKALEAVLLRQVGDTETLVSQAAELAEARRPKLEQALTDNLSRIMTSVEDADPDRIAQELAILTVKADVTEEIDRLVAHVKAARTLLAETAPVGRRLDFLMQEFNREANTLCSKAGDSDLTKCGLELKALIEQMREQVQNME